MKKIGIIICSRYHTCGGGKCFHSLRERTGAFSIYPQDEEVEVVGYSTCGGCPGGNIEYVPEEMIKNGADVIHLATGMVVGYPPCFRIADFKSFIETRYGVPVVVGTHPIPTKYWENHERLSYWKRANMPQMAPELFKDSAEVRKQYN